MSYRAFREFTPHGVVMSGLNSAFQSIPEDAQHGSELLPTIVFIAFSVEAYINWIGSEHLGIWPDVERLSWKKKLNILYVQAGSGLKWGRQPFQSIDSLFRIRDKLAHGKLEIAYGPIRESESEAHADSHGPTAPQPDWHKSITISNVDNWKLAFESLRKELDGIYHVDNSLPVVLARTGTEKINSEESGA